MIFSGGNWRVSIGGKDLSDHFTEVKIEGTIEPAAAAIRKRGRGAALRLIEGGGEGAPKDHQRPKLRLV